MLGGLRDFLDNDPAFYGYKIADPRLAGRIRAEQISSILSFTPYMLFANVLCAMVLTSTLAKTPASSFAMIWAFCLTALIALVYMRWRKSNTQAKRNYASVRAARRAALNGLIMSMFWAIVPFVFFTKAPEHIRIVIACILVGMICGGAFALAAIPVAAVAFTAPICLGIAITLTFLDLQFGMMMGILVGIFSFVILRATNTLAATLVERMLGEFELEKQRDMIGILLGEFEENSSDWMWETDGQLRLTYVSQGLLNVSGRSPTESFGRKCVDTLIGPASTLDAQQSAATAQMLEHFARHTPFRELECQVQVGNARRWWSFAARPARDPNGRFTGFRGFVRDVTDKREKEARIAYLARYDAITGLPNRILFGEYMANGLAAIQNNSGSFALLCIDLDGFKEVNDTHGHAAGDEILKIVAERIRNTIAPEDRAARLGGDEFAVLQSTPPSSFEVSSLARRLIAAISAPAVIGGQAMSVGASIGIALAPEDGVVADKLLINADLALYKSKNSGRGSWHFFEAGMDQEARERRALEQDLRLAIDRDELSLQFQPQMDMRSGKYTQCEALLRWHHPERGLIPPSTFIPLAEDSGLIVRIGEWVIRQSCHAAVRWPSHLKVAVNLSAAQFHSPGLLPAIMHALEDSGLEPNRLEIEITESTLVSNVDSVKAILQAVSKLGVRVALDDFGTGYSSLSYLRMIRFDKIKIDKSFVSEVLTDHPCASIIRAVIRLARDLDMRVTAEGIETQEQLAWLEREGCDEAQGYLISPPVSLDRFKELLDGAGQNPATLAPAKVA